MKLVKKKLKKDPVFQKKFKKTNQDAITLLSGGRSRIRGHGDEIDEAEELLFDIKEKAKFWQLKD